MKPREGRTEFPPGRSETADSSRVMYSRASLLRPARGCSCEGSANAELFRKESTPCAEDGSNGGGLKLVVGSGGDGAWLCSGLLWLDFWPVNAFQREDISAGGQYTREEGK